VAQVGAARSFVRCRRRVLRVGGQHYLTLDAIKANRDALLRFTEAHFAAAIVIAVLIYAGAVAFSLPGALILSLAMGFVFGRWIGTVLVVVAATAGATIVFLAARYIFADAARKRLGALGEKINAGFTENAFNYMLFLRLVPAFPFFLVNLAPAFTSIPLRTFVLATFIGIIPGTFVFVNLGETLGRIDSLQGYMVSVQTVGAFALWLLALVPVVVRKMKSNGHRTRNGRNRACPGRMPRHVLATSHSHPMCHPMPCSRTPIAACRPGAVLTGVASRPGLPRGGRRGVRAASTRRRSTRCARQRQG
jgi:uncharacterized membrane protein YdjX (TVP38/TMEM64 family)